MDRTASDGAYTEAFSEIEADALRILEFNKIKEMLAQKCVSTIGRTYAEGLAPSVYEDKVTRDLAQTTDAEQFIMRNGSPPLGHIQDIRGVLKRVELEAVLNPAELLQVASVLRTVRGMKRYGRAASPAEGNGAAPGTERADMTGNVMSMIISLVENQKLENNINACIISEEEIADDASPELASIRRRIKRIQDSIKDKLNALLHSAAYQKFMQDSLVTIRHDRYVIPVKLEHRAEIKGLVHDMSASGATVFIEPMAVVEANNEIRELKAMEAIEIERILSELTSEVGGMLPELHNDVETLGLLDFLFAKAKLSLDFNCTAPDIGADKKIHIKRGRHPLLPRETVVPIDFWMADGVNTIIITGPNTGGKTVTLKTAGLLTLMAQAGLHIPAGQGSTLRVFNKVFADIGDEQSIEQNLSTFSSHMRNIVHIMREADDGTLALFDEIGAGTDPTEGAALAMSILECLHQTGTVSVATTHYSELKIYALTTPGIENACCEFDVNTLRPTYKLLIGLPGKSNAFAISGRLGLAPEILGRAREFLEKEDVEFEDILHAIGRNREASEQDRRAAEQARLEIEDLRGALAKQRDQMDRQKEAVMKEARENARRILLESRREAEDVLNRLKQLEDEQDASERKKGAKELRNRLKTRIDGVDSTLAVKLPPRDGYVTPPENLKIGDTVVIVNLNQKGVVQTLPDQNGNALIRVGIMSVTAHASNIKVLDEQRAINDDAARKMSEPADGAARGESSKPRSINVRAEIDLRGTRLEEAVSRVDRYLDDASYSGLNEVAIIHGKGTGALRSGIQDFLRGHPRIKSFRNGNYGEGDMGVTIAAIK